MGQVLTLQKHADATFNAKFSSRSILQVTSQGSLTTTTAMAAKTLLLQLFSLSHYAIIPYSLLTSNVGEISWSWILGGCSHLERERKIRRREFTSSMKHPIRKFHQKGYCTCRVVVWLLSLKRFLTFSLPSPSSLLKLPSEDRTETCYMFPQQIASVKAVCALCYAMSIFNGATMLPEMSSHK